MLFNATDHAMMARAMSMAEKGRAVATPNPFVGCVIVKNGRVIGEGYTQAGGRPHAEAHALASCTESAEGATVYSTLEPCALHAASRGPACSDLLVDARVARVVSAMHDPYEGIDGKGHDRLQEAGIQLDVGLMQAEVKKQLKAFLARATRGRPFVTLKVAASIDGKTALANGQSKWITSPEARRDVHAMRRDACALLTGIGTVLADDPALTVRDVACDRQPLRILLDSRLDVADNAKILQGGNTLIVTATGDELRAQTLMKRGIPVTRIETDAVKGKVNLFAMMQMLGAKNLNSILVETGARLNASLLAAGVVDEIVFYLAPSIIGDHAKGLFALPELQLLQDKIALEFMDVRQIGRDIRIHATISE